jgi:hypothetical protein
VRFPGNEDVRHAIVLLLVVACAMKAYCSNGRSRCYWLAFSFVLFVAVLGQWMIVPTMAWVRDHVRPLFTSIDIYGDAGGRDLEPRGPSAQRVEFVSETIRFSVNLILAGIAGFIGTLIYDQSRAAQEARRLVDSSDHGDFNR